MSTQPSEALCQKCGIGFMLPSGVCDHCNQPPVATVKQEYKDLSPASPSEAHILTALAITKGRAFLTPTEIAQLIRDSEARAVEAALSKERDAVRSVMEQIEHRCKGWAEINVYPTAEFMMDLYDQRHGLEPTPDPALTAERERSRVLREALLSARGGLCAAAIIDGTLELINRALEEKP